MDKQTSFFTLICVVLIFTSCDKTPKETSNLSAANTTQIMVAKPYKNAQLLTEEFKTYWYNGTAEISSFKLEQARYGEIHEGTAVLIFVTEDFLPDVQVKADKDQPENIKILKLNATKNFITGIYPYHTMHSTFYPVSNNYHALKVTASVQEWCGQTYSQINNRGQFEILSHSYFEGEADENFNLEASILENELFNQLRIDPKSLPTGAQQIIPSLEFMMLKHKATEAYQAYAKLTDSSYTINYPDLKRTVEIKFSPQFPYIIRSWEESYPDKANGDILFTKATRINTILEPYWQKNKPADLYLREQLGL